MAGLGVFEVATAVVAVIGAGVAIWAAVMQTIEFRKFSRWRREQPWYLADVAATTLEQRSQEITETVATQQGERA